MEYITTTELRTKSPALVKALSEGKKVPLVHRSQIIGYIQPATTTPVVFDAAKFKAIRKKINLSHTTYEEREKIYREHLERKYGKYIPRR